MHLDVGNGNYPHVLERRDLYWPNDPRGESISLFFEETDEDLNKNGVLDPGEDSDADGILDQPNYLPGTSPDAVDLAARADALMTFYEKQHARPSDDAAKRTYDVRYCRHQAVA